MCFGADRKKTIEMRDRRCMVKLFKLAQVVDGQLRGPWKSNVILGLRPYSDMGAPRVVFALPEKTGPIPAGIQLTISALSWRMNTELPSSVQADEGFYLATSARAIKNYALDCEMRLDRMVILPVEISSLAIEAVSYDDDFVVVASYRGPALLEPFATELQEIGDDKFIAKYDACLDTEEVQSAS